MLPGANIEFSNGNIGSVEASADGVFGLLASAVAVPDKLELQKSYKLKGMADVADLGIEEATNAKLHKTLKEFYEEAGEGTPLYLHAFDKSESVSDWFTEAGGVVPAEALLDYANGEIKGLFTCYDPSGVVTVADGVDADVALAKQQAQLLAENYINKKAAPFFVLLEAYAFTGEHADLVDLTEGTDNRVGIVIGSSQESGDGTVNHIVMGRLAKSQVQVNAGKVKDGELQVLKAYIAGEPVEEYDVEELHDKGYITLRTHIGKAGYYITDDPLATNSSDDYRYISRRRVIDKAYRIAHSIASDEINNDFDLTNSGSISPFYAKALESVVEQAIYSQMTVNGELSADATDNNDLGVKATFDTTINVAATSTINMQLSVRPRGTARWFNVELGFNTNLNN